MQLDGLNYYIYSDGNHRTAIAKFHLHNKDKCMLHGVRVSHYTIDYDVRNLYDALQKEIRLAHLNVECTITSEIIERRDGPGWKEDQFRLGFKWFDWSIRSETLMTKNEAMTHYESLLNQRMTKELLPPERTSLVKKLRDLIIGR